MKLKNLLYAFIVSLLFCLLYPVGYYVLDTKYPVTIPNSTSSNHKGIVSYIINLDRSPERYEYVKPNIDKLGYPIERISAVDGNKLSDEEINQKVDMKSYQRFKNYIPKRGTIGCSLSHIKFWTKFLESNYEYAIVFEDDVSFDPDKLGTVIKELAECPKLWDIVTFESNHRGTPVTVKTLQNDQKLSVYLSHIVDTGAYMINRKAALKLLEKALPIKMQVDYYFTRSWEFDLKFRGIEPRIVHQKFGDSNINITSQVGEQKETFHFHKRLYNVQTSIIRFFHNFKEYIEDRV